MTNTQLNFEDMSVSVTTEMLVKREPIRFAPETEIERLIASLDEPIPQMIAKNDAERNYCDRIAEKQRKTPGMDKIELEMFDELIRYYIKRGQYRNVLYLVLQANYGMRFSDVVRLRWCHLLNADGTIKESFTLLNGELKTGKQNIYYNNSATKYIIKIYLSRTSGISIYDYLFTSNSNNNGNWLTLEETEAKELYGNDIKRLQKKLKSEKSTEKVEQINAKIEELKREMSEYRSESTDKHKLIQQPLTHEAALTEILKKGLRAIGVKPLNCLKSDLPNADIKLGTHSFRKCFGEYFYETGFKLKERGVEEVQILDSTILKLLQDKYMHSSSSTTRAYNNVERKAFKTICLQLNIGFDALLKATGMTD